jgi:hypothetical protein
VFPSPETIEMMAAAMPEAINAYSIAVAPRSSARNRPAARRVSERTVDFSGHLNHPGWHDG